MSPRSSYVARINRVVDYIDAHLATPLSLETLAQVAHFSPWHFHRVFQAFTGETLADRVRRRRLEVAAIRLLATPPQAALAIALDVGFASPAVFTRAFKAHFGATPSAWRRGAWHAWAVRHRLQLSKIHQAFGNPHQDLADAFRDDAGSRSNDLQGDPKGAPMDVEIKTLADTRVAYMRHVGPYGDPAISRMWQRFNAWRVEHGLADGRHAAFGIGLDSPDITAPERCRYDACVEVDAGFRPEGEVGVQTIRGGRLACAKFHGAAPEIHTAWMRLYGEWLPASGWQVDDRPCIELYGSQMSFDPKTGAFSCELGLPVCSR